MTLTQDDLDALRTILKEELATKEELQSLELKMDSRFDMVSEQILGLYKRDETREQEYLALKEQFSRLEKQVQ